MPVTVGEVLKVMEALAPPGLAEDWDNPGLQLGNPGDGVSRVLLALDVDMAVAREALELGAGLIISHHPLFLKPIKNIRSDNARGSLVAELIKGGLSVYSSHTNLDSASGGVNDVLAGALGLGDIKVLKPGRGKQYLKLVAFVPAGHQESVMEAITGAGSGHIGRYSHCSFQVPGTGTFMPQGGARPFIGSQGTLERVEEIRLETILPAALAPRVIDALLKAHPYEEPAYDLYALENKSTATGLGRTGVLPKSLTLAEFAELVRERLGLKGLRWGGDPKKEVLKVALCGGSGADFWPAALAAGAQVLVTGDVGYHAARDMAEAGLGFVDPGHFGSEAVVLPRLKKVLEEALTKEAGVEFFLSRRQGDVFNFMLGDRSQETGDRSREAAWSILTTE